MSTQKTVRPEAGTVEENTLQIETGKAEQIIEALNTDLVKAYVLYHQLHNHHWNVEGAEFLNIHVFLQQIYEDVEDAADPPLHDFENVVTTPHIAVSSARARSKIIEILVDCTFNFLGNDATWAVPRCGPPGQSLVRWVVSRY